MIEKMEFINCKTCGRSIPEDSIECVHCDVDTGLYNDYDKNIHFKNKASLKKSTNDYSDIEALFGGYQLKLPIIEFKGNFIFKDGIIFPKLGSKSYPFPTRNHIVDPQPYTGHTTQGSLKDGKKEGPWVHYHSNGRLSSIGVFINGLREGAWICYHENGELFWKGSYKNGLREGLWGIYYNNARLKTQGNFNSGKKEGFWICYHENGKLFWKGDYKNDLKEGIHEFYDENHQLIRKENYKEGEKVID